MLTLCQIAQAYVEACEKIEAMIKASKFKITHIMEEVGLGRDAFYARLRARNWEPKHLVIFGQLLQGGGQQHV